jgi:xylulose-5-phosphate/fructose-6-phosphate phosphoketolase
MDENELISWYKKYHRYTNYLSAAMLYLKDNYFLERDLAKEDLKPRILGHWGTVPGINFIYGGLNAFLKTLEDEEKLQNLMLITGPGHGAPAVISGLYLEQTLEKFYPEATLDLNGFGHVCKQFSWPGGFQSHTWPGLPGQISEGGELGYSLGIAFGTVLDNPDLITVCVVGDGEAETGTLSASWQSNKFLNHKTDGVVLPILHLNGYRISGPTIMSAMSEVELRKYFEGLGYRPYFVDEYELEDSVFIKFFNTLNAAYDDIKSYKENGGLLPMIVLKTKKGWTGPKFIGDKKLEDNNFSHGIPLTKPQKDEEEFQVLKEWLESYQIKDLVNKDGSPIEEIFKFIPQNKIGQTKASSGDPESIDLELPALEDEGVRIFTRGSRPDSRMIEASQYFRDIFDLNIDNKNFRIFSPDESESNLMDVIFQETGRAFNRKLREHDENYSENGRIMEILSENVLQAWMQGYNLTGRHGVLISYEAFLGIITSQIDQYLKYLKQTLEFTWRKPLPSMNYIATSTLWRQEHNGFTHQNPTLINSLLVKQTENINIYFPTDANSLLAVLERCFKDRNKVNLIVACKRELPQWISIEEARLHIKNGISVWDWASNLNGEDEKNLGRIKNEVDVVLASAGDYQTQETLAAAQILKETIPELKFKYVNVNNITNKGFGNISDISEYDNYFTKESQVIFNFHGYPEAIKQITWNTNLAHRTTILGYRENGGTTTPFDMQVQNGTSRYNVCIKAAEEAAKVNPNVKVRGEELIKEWTKLLNNHKYYIKEHGDDLPIVKNFHFKFD